MPIQKPHITTGIFSFCLTSDVIAELTGRLAFSVVVAKSNAVTVNEVHNYI